MNRIRTQFINCSKNQIILKNEAFFDTQCDTFIHLKWIWLMVAVLIWSFDMWYDWYSTWLCPTTLQLKNIYPIHNQALFVLLRSREMKPYYYYVTWFINNKINNLIYRYWLCLIFLIYNYHIVQIFWLKFNLIFVMFFQSYVSN